MALLTVPARVVLVINALSLRPASELGGSGRPWCRTNCRAATNMARVVSGKRPESGPGDPRGPHLRQRAFPGNTANNGRGAKGRPTCWSRSHHWRKAPQLRNHRPRASRLVCRSLNSGERNHPPYRHTPDRVPGEVEPTPLRPKVIDVAQFALSDRLSAGCGQTALLCFIENQWPGLGATGQADVSRCLTTVMPTSPTPG